MEITSKALFGSKRLYSDQISEKFAYKTLFTNCCFL